MVQSLTPEVAARKITQMDPSTVVNLLVRIDKGPTSWRSRSQKIGEGALVGTVTAAAYQLPSIVQQGGSIYGSIISSFVGSAASTVLLRTLYSSTTPNLTFHGKVPLVGGHTLARSANTTEITHATLWSSIVTAAQSAAMHYLKHL